MRSRLALWLCFALVGCSAAITRTIRPPESPITVSAVVITPVRITGAEAPGWRRFELAQRQVDVALRDCGDRLAFFGPGEVQISRWEEPGWLGNTAVPLLARAAIPVDQAVLIRTTVEQRLASSTQEREDAKGLRKGGVANQETTWLLTVELIHPSSRQTLAELSGKVVIDPFAEPTGEEEFDSAPPMTRLLESLTREALAIARRWQVERPTPKDSGLTLALAPAITAAQADAAAAQPDALQAEIWMQGRARFLSPWLTDAQAAKLARMAPSLFVVAAPGGLSVQPGDLILSIDGQPPLPEVLARKRLSGVPVEVRVGRDGNERDAVIP
jgi:hypothetical protein